MADKIVKVDKAAPVAVVAPEQAPAGKFKGVRKLTWKGLQLEELVKLPNEKLMELFRARVKRKFRSGVGHRFTNLIKKVQPPTHHLLD